MVRKALQGCTISLFGTNPNWDARKQAKVSQWLTHLSGKYSSKFGSQVTHLVVSEKRWREDPRPAVLRQALEEKTKGRDLKIVNFDWLEDTLNAQSKKKESNYEWTKRDADAAKAQAKKDKAAGKGSAKSVPGLMREVFEESTEQFVDPVEKRKLDRQLEEERERQRLEKEERMRRRREQAKLFGRGSQKAKNQILSESHHIYQDSTGFKYDIQVTKVDARHNRNERWGLTFLPNDLTFQLQIFESNTTPHTYATNTQHAGTAITLANNLVSAIGTPFPTALHAFKTEFFSRTGVHWDERISAHFRQLREKKIERGAGTGSVSGSVRGVAVPESATREKSFEERRFEYHPPGFGPKGEVDEEERERVRGFGVELTHNKPAAARKAAEDVGEGDGGKRKAVEEWMSGQEQEQPPAAAGEEDIDFEKWMEEEGYPFEKPVSNVAANADPAEQSIDGFDETTSQNLQATDTARGAGTTGLGGATQGADAGMADFEPSSPNYEHEGAATVNELDESLDWDAIAKEMNNDPGWLDRELEAHTHAQQNGSRHDSMDAQMPSFTTHPTTDGTSFQHGTQEIGETQVAERAGGEFLEEFANERQQPTPPASAKKPGFGASVLGGLNLGSSILGKRKAAPVQQGEAGKKAQKTGEGDEDGLNV